MPFTCHYHDREDACIFVERVIDPEADYLRVRLGTDLTLFMSQEHAGQLAYALLNPVPEGVANPQAPPQCVLDMIQTPEVGPTEEHVDASCQHIDLLPDEDVSEPPQVLEVLPTIKPYTLDELKELI